MPTNSEILSSILDLPELKTLADEGRDAEIASYFNTNSTFKQSTTSVETYLSLSGKVGADLVRRLIVSVEAASAVDVLLAKLKLRLEGDTGIDINHAVSRGMLGNLAAANITNGLTAEDVQTLSNVCDLSVVITTEQVSDSLKSYRNL